MTLMQSILLVKISIKDWLKTFFNTMHNGQIARPADRMPAGIYRATLSLGLFVGLLAALSFGVGNVMVNNDYETIAFAKPAAEARTIRQHDVAHFGNKVSNAFGIHDEVATEFADWILEASERHEVTPELLASLVVTESSFRKSVRSHVGAVGPTQIRPDYWGKFCGHSDLNDPEQNVYCGAQVLSHFIDRCNGDTNCARAAYNVGPYANREGAALRYVKKIDGYMSSLENAAAL
jgi:soluble lytic murein transglycosylase-like protein